MSPIELLRTLRQRQIVVQEGREAEWTKTLQISPHASVQARRRGISVEEILRAYTHGSTSRTSKADRVYYRDARGDRVLELVVAHNTATEAVLVTVYYDQQR